METEAQPSSKKLYISLPIPSGHFIYFKATVRKVGKSKTYEVFYILYYSQAAVKDEIAAFLDKKFGLGR